DLTVTLTGTQPWSITWSDSVTESGITNSPHTRTVSPPSTTMYSVTQVSDAHSCTNNTSSGSVTVTINPTPAAPSPSNNGPVCEGATLELFANVTADSYSWTGPNSFTSSAQNPTISNATTAASGMYELTVTSSGCTSAAGSTSATVNPTSVGGSA